MSVTFVTEYPILQTLNHALSLNVKPLTKLNLISVYGPRSMTVDLKLRQGPSLLRPVDCEWHVKLFGASFI